MMVSKKIFSKLTVAGLSFFSRLKRFSGLFSGNMPFF